MVHCSVRTVTLNFIMGQSSSSSLQFHWEENAENAHRRKSEYNVFLHTRRQENPDTYITVFEIRAPGFPNGSCKYINDIFKGDHILATKCRQGELYSILWTHRNEKTWSEEETYWQGDNPIECGSYLRFILLKSMKKYEALGSHPHGHQKVGETSVLVGRAGPGHLVQEVQGLWARHPISGEGQGVEVHPSDGRHLFLRAPFIDLHHS